MKSKGKHINREQLPSPYGLLGKVPAETMPEFPPIDENYGLFGDMDSDESDSIVCNSLPNGVYLTEVNGLLRNARFRGTPSVRVNALRTHELLLRVPERSMSNGPCLIEANELFSNATKVQLFGQEYRLFDFGPSILAGTHLNSGQETGMPLQLPPANSYGALPPLNARGITGALIKPQTIQWTCSRCNCLNSNNAFYCKECKICKMDKASTGESTATKSKIAECDNSSDGARESITQLHIEKRDQF